MISLAPKAYPIISNSLKTTSAFDLVSAAHFLFLMSNILYSLSLAYEDAFHNAKYNFLRVLHNGNFFSVELFSLHSTSSIFVIVDYTKNDL